MTTKNSVLKKNLIILPPKELGEFQLALIHLKTTKVMKSKTLLIQFHLSPAST